MNRLMLPIVVILFLIAIAAVGCDGDATTPPVSKELVSSCVACHSDIELLEETAAPQPEEEEPEEASGEG